MLQIRNTSAQAPALVDSMALGNSATIKSHKNGTLFDYFTKAYAYWPKQQVNKSSSTELPFFPVKRTKAKLDTATGATYN